MLGAREAVRQHPELAGTYLNLRAAELASKGLRDPEETRRFVAQVRRVPADNIERGEPLQPVRLRERAARKNRGSLNRKRSKAEGNVHALGDECLALIVDQQHHTQLGITHEKFIEP